MKIYEIRDVSNDESYFTQGYFSDKDNAILLASGDDSWNVADEPEDCVILAVFEIELDAHPWDEGHKKIFEMTFSKEWRDDSDDECWKKEITFPKVSTPTPKL